MSQVTDERLKLIRSLFAAMGNHPSYGMPHVVVENGELVSAIDELLRLRSAPSPLDEGMLVVEPRGRDDLHRISKVLNTPNQLSPESVKVLDKAVADAYASLSPQEPAAGEGDVQLTSGAIETLEALDEAAVFFRKEAAYECENMGSGGSSIALGRWKRFYHAIENVAHDIRHPDRAPVDPALLAAQKDGQEQFVICGWGKGYVSHTPDGIDYDEEIVPGKDPPPGDGWIPVYRKTAIASQFAGKGDL